MVSDMDSSADIKPFGSAICYAALSPEWLCGFPAAVLRGEPDVAKQVVVEFSEIPTLKPAIVASGRRTQHSAAGARQQYG
jgi:hypothetical protein